MNGPPSPSGPGAERLNLPVQVTGHAGDLGLGQARDAQGLDQLVHPAGGHPEQVAGRHDADQGRLGAPLALEQPLGDIGPGAQLGHRDVDRADAGVQGPGR